MVGRERAGELLLEMVTMARAFRVAGHRQQTISGTKIGVLQRLKHCDARLGELAQQLSISASVASRAVESLESNGLVERRTDDDDARAFLISLTDLGRATVAERERRIADKFAEVLDGWTPAQSDQALDVLQRLNTHLDELTVALETDDRKEPTV